MIKAKNARLVADNAINFKLAEERAKISSLIEQAMNEGKYNLTVFKVLSINEELKNLGYIVKVHSKNDEETQTIISW